MAAHTAPIAGPTIRRSGTAAASKTVTSAPEPMRGRRDFEPMKPAPTSTTRPGVSAAAGVRVVERAQVVHNPVAAGYGQSAGPAAGGEQDRVGADRWVPGQIDAHVRPVTRITSRR